MGMLQEVENLANVFPVVQFVSYITDRFHLTRIFAATLLFPQFRKYFVNQNLKDILQYRHVQFLHAFVIKLR